MSPWLIGSLLALLFSDSKESEFARRVALWSVFGLFAFVLVFAALAYLAVLALIVAVPVFLVLSFVATFAARTTVNAWRRAKGLPLPVPPPCPHKRLLPRWDNLDETGDRERIARYVCESCQKFFTLSEVDALKRLSAPQGR